MPKSTFHTGINLAKEFVRKNQLFVLTILVLLAVAGGSRYLTGQLVPSDGSGGGAASSSSFSNLRTCSDKGTPFESANRLADAQNVYVSRIAAVMKEREQILRTPSMWICTPPSPSSFLGGAASSTSPMVIDPPMPVLNALANSLPGWHYYTDQSFLGLVSRPTPRLVTFDAFGAILNEFQREYECKLTLLQSDVLEGVAGNRDTERSDQFCCSADGCVNAVTSVNTCTSPITSDPTCNAACPINITASDLASRLKPYHEELTLEKNRARIALERTMHTLRSFEVNYVIARQLTCSQRASLDLRNEMSLLADAVSCMPKIWDAVTSIHDRAQ